MAGDLDRSRGRSPTGGGATLLDVARAAGVSRTTVSNAFNRPDQLSAGLRGRVLATARALGYAGPNPVARMLRTGRVGERIGQRVREHDPHHPDPPRAQHPRHRVRPGVAELARGRQHALAQARGELVGAVERVGDGRSRDAEP